MGEALHCQAFREILHNRSAGEQCLHTDGFVGESHEIAYSRAFSRLLPVGYQRRRASRSRAVRRRQLLSLRRSGDALPSGLLLSGWGDQANLLPRQHVQCVDRQAVGRGLRSLPRGESALTPGQRLCSLVRCSPRATAAARAKVAPSCAKAFAGSGRHFLIFAVIERR